MVNSQFDARLSGVNEYLIPSLRDFSPTPVIVEGSGAFVKDVDGIEYLDFTAGVGVLGLGHCHPKIIQAIKEQAMKLTHCGVYFHSPMVSFSEKLAEVVPKPLKKSFFCNSGAEAVEGAAKLAKKYWSAKCKIGGEFIALQHSFHGRLGLTSSLSGYRRSVAFTNMPGIIHAPAPYCYRCKLDYPKCGVYCAKFLEEIIDSEVALGPAAFIYEPIIGVGGVIIPTSEYHSIVADICRTRDIPLVVDEIFTGFGRTGKMFASEHWEIAPDIMCVSKAIAGGLPLGAFIASERITASFSPADHYSTFGGNPIACAAAIATLQVIKEERLIENSAEMGEYLISRITGIAGEHRLIGDVRGKGLFVGVELVLDKEKKTPASEHTKRVIGGLLRKKILLNASGVGNSTLRVIPPLAVSKEQLDSFIEALDETLTDVEKDTFSSSS